MNVLSQRKMNLAGSHGCLARAASKSKLLLPVMLLGALSGPAQDEPASAFSGKNPGLNWTGCGRLLA
jgi:hypothetical protein